MLQTRCNSSPGTTNVNFAGMPIWLDTSSAAPVTDRLRTMQSIAVLPNSIVPAFMTRWRDAIRVSTMKSRRPQGSKELIRCGLSQDHIGVIRWNRNRAGPYAARKDYLRQILKLAEDALSFKFAFNTDQLQRSDDLLHCRSFTKWQQKPLAIDPMPVAIKSGEDRVDRATACRAFVRPVY